MSYLTIVLALPILFAALAFCVGSTMTLGLVNILVNLAIVAVVFFMAFYGGHHIGHLSISQLDHLAIFSLAIVSLISLLVSLYSFAYFKYQCDRHEDFEIKNMQKFYSLSGLLLAAMLFASVANDIGWTWIALEMTTLIVALALGVFRRTVALESAWNYLIICSVGLILALMGIAILLVAVGGDINTESGLLFSSFFKPDLVFNPVLVKAAFVFILIGLGTKMALAPMHAWLPEAIERAEIPLAIFLCCALKQVVFVFLVRLKYIVDHALGSTDYTASLLIFFGLLSVVLAALFMINQHNLKRMLATSSIETMGIAAIALGLPYKEALVVGLIFLLLQSLIKAGMFFLVGNIQLVYGSVEVEEVGNTMKILPTASSLLIVSMLAINAFPPFAMFMTKFVLVKYLTTYNYWLSLLFLVAGVLVLGGYVFTFGRILFFKAPKQREWPNFDYKSNLMMFAKVPVLLSLALASASLIFYHQIFNYLSERFL